MPRDCTTIPGNRKVRGRIVKQEVGREGGKQDALDGGYRLFRNKQYTEREKKEVFLLNIKESV
jgi:hypothetical protein